MVSFTFAIALLLTVMVTVVRGDDRYEPTAAEKVILQQSPCSDTDSVCWARMCNKYLNEIRKENSTSLENLELGNSYMLDNAIEHSIRQANVLRQIFHQKPLPKVGAGECEQQINGENVATIWSTNLSIKNYAYQCVGIQWRHSPGHYENMVRDWFKSAITGIHVSEFTEGGRTYKRVTCTQIFDDRTYESSAGKCATVSEGSVPVPSPTSSMAPTPSMAPIASPAASTSPAPSVPVPSLAPMSSPEPSSEPISSDFDVANTKVCSNFASIIRNLRTGQLYASASVNGECRFCPVTGTVIRGTKPTVDLGKCLTSSISLAINNSLIRRN